MSGRVSIVENESWRRLEASRQELVETSLRMVCGARLGTTDSLLEAVSVGRKGGTEVFVFPVLLPAEETRVIALKKALEKAMPFPKPFGLLVLLVGADGFNPDTLLDSFWVDVLDGLYDIAVPTAVVAWQGSNGGTPAVEGFQLAACASSLFRELDSLEELGRLSSLLAELEARVDSIELETGDNSERETGDAVPGSGFRKPGKPRGSAQD
jgi:hypothetical protein